jgi:hypothetical protein
MRWRAIGSGLKCNTLPGSAPFPPVAFTQFISCSIGLTHGFDLPQLSQPKIGRMSSRTR